jgi:hypothetical protein
VKGGCGAGVVHAVLVCGTHTGTVCARAGECADAVAAQHGVGGGECTGTDPGESMATNQQRGKKSQPTFGGECECPGVAPVEAGCPRHVNAVHVVVE